MAKLAAVVESLDTVPETQRDLYVKGSDNKFWLDTDYKDEIDKIAKNRDDILGEKKGLKGVEDMLKEAGVKPSDIKQILKERKEAAEKKALEAGEFDKVRQQIVDQHTAELGKRDQRESALVGTISELMVDARAVEAITKAKGSVRLLLPVVKARAQVKETDGKFNLVVTDDKGVPQVRGTKSEPMTLDQLVEELKADKEYAGAFDGTGASGSGAPASGARGGAPGITSRSQLKNSKAKSDYIKEHGLENFKKLAP